MCDSFCADGALRAALVLNHNRLLQVATEIFGHHAAEHIGRTARRIGYNELDGTDRIVGPSPFRRGHNEAANQSRR